MEDAPSFSSVEEEVCYYKNLAEEYKNKWLETQQELEEFQESSRELEAELEAQLEQHETRSKEFRSLNNTLQLECDSLQEKFKKLSYESQRQIADLQDDLGRTKAVKEDLHRYIRELEQANDDLERAKRATLSSLEDFESRLNQAIERNAFLENELDDREALGVTVQRLKDEIRDLRQEHLIQQTFTKQGILTSPSVQHDNRKLEKLLEIDSNKLSSESDAQTGSPTRVNPQLSGGSTPLTPSARISALNIVGDLLRKVGALESKLASCRSFVKESPQHPEKEDLGSPATTPTKAKHIARSPSLPSPRDVISLTA